MRTFATVALLTCTGCGTVVNLATPLQERKVYGGVRNDVDVIEKIFEGDASLGSSPDSGAGALILLALLALPFVDLPLSALGDTLTLPLTRWLDKQ